METALIAAIVGALVGGGVSYLLALDVTITDALRASSDEPLDPLTLARSGRH